MEAQAPYHTPTPRGPRNLVPHVAQWLRGLGFTALEADHGAIATVQAHWDSPEGHRFYFYYEWSALKALVSLNLTQAGECPRAGLDKRPARGPPARSAPAAARR